MTKMTLICAAGAVALMAAACSDNTQEPAVPPADEANTTMTDPMAPAPSATTGGMTLGMTNQQLEDADIVSADGTDLGDVERVITDASGAVTGLAVSLDGRDGHVVVPVDGLTPTADGDVQTTMTAEALAALPAWTEQAM
jgi:hypothetical protein